MTVFLRVISRFFAAINSAEWKSEVCPLAIAAVAPEHLNRFMHPRLTPLLFMAAATLLPARTLIYCGTLIDGVADAPRKEMTVIVDAERIVGVAAGYSTATDGDKVIDLKSATVTPGWIDCHVHLDGQQSPTSYMDRYLLNPGDY